MRFFILYLIANISFAEIAYKLGIGSCVDQDYPTPAWASLEKESLDSFFFLGDNIYGDVPSGKLDNVKKSYKKLNDQMPLWLKNMEKLVIWDDHDYGLNDAGANYIYKAESQQIYNDAWNIDQNDPRRSREGIYFSELKYISAKSELLTNKATTALINNRIPLAASHTSTTKQSTS